MEIIEAATRAFQAVFTDQSQAACNFAEDEAELADLREGGPDRNCSGHGHAQEPHRQRSGDRFADHHHCQHHQDGHRRLQNASGSNSMPDGNEEDTEKASRIVTASPAASDGELRAADGKPGQKAPALSKHRKARPIRRQFPRPGPAQQGKQFPRSCPDDLLQRPGITTGRGEPRRQAAPEFSVQRVPAGIRHPGLRFLWAQR